MTWILFGIAYLASMVWSFLCLLAIDQFHHSKPRKGFNILTISVVLFAPITGLLLIFALPYIFSERVSNFVDRLWKDK